MNHLKLYLHVQEVDPRKQAQKVKCLSDVYISISSTGVYDLTSQLTSYSWELMPKEDLGWVQQAVLISVIEEVVVKVELLPRHWHCDQIDWVKITPISICSSKTTL